MESDRRAARVVVTGRVQGVGYRAWVKVEATRLNLDGWVRNRRDGKVEALFAGSGDAVERMLTACRNGPPAAIVERVDIHAWPEPTARGFRVAPTA